MKTSTTNIYQQQAIDFLTKYGIECKIKFRGKRLHFPDDKEPRNIYEVSFEKESGEYFEVNFGASLADGTCTEYDVLACLTKSDPGDFEEFCSEFGYDEDSRRAYSTWENVVEEWDKVHAFFTEEEITELQEIQ